MPAKIIDLHLHGIGGIDSRSTDPGAMLGIAGSRGEGGRLGDRPLYLLCPPGHHAGPDGGGEGRHGAAGAGQARIAGVHLEGPFLNPLMAGALDAGSFIPPSERALRELTEGCEDVVRIVTIAPELPGALRSDRADGESGHQGQHGPFERDL